MLARLADIRSIGGGESVRPAFPSERDDLLPGGLLLHAAGRRRPVVRRNPERAHRDQPDGTQEIVEYAPTRTCRDSAGRTRSEVPVYLQPEGPQVGPLLIQLRDPVAAPKFVLYAVNETVYRQSLPPNRTVHPPAPMPIPADKEVSRSMEDLGTQIMEGLLVEGRRFTLPPGSSGSDLTVTRN